MGEQLVLTSSAGRLATCSKSLAIPHPCLVKIEKVVGYRLLFVIWFVG